MESTIHDRLLLLLKEQAGRPDADVGSHFARRGFWKRMEEVTGISSGRWRNFFSGQQKATTDMIAAAAHLYPYYAFWLATGITDSANGHSAPVTATTFPERLYGTDVFSHSYFQQSLQLLQELLSRTEDSEDLERTQIGLKWRGGKAIAVAYELSRTDEYRCLQQTWLKRRHDRDKHIARNDGSHRPSLNRRENTEKNQDRMAFADPRTSHQDDGDLFYAQRNEEP